VAGRCAFDITSDDVPAQAVQPFEAEHLATGQRNRVRAVGDRPHLRSQLLEGVDLWGPDLAGEVQGVRQRVDADRPLSVDRFGAEERRVEVVEGERLELPGEP
jgi:hypothetical protein